MGNFLILLVEDETPKLTHIKKFLKDTISNVEVITARSVTSAFDVIEDEVPDLILLDMNLPTFDVGNGESGGRPQGFGGIEVLRRLEMSGVQIETLVLTGYEAFPDETGKIIDLQTLRENLFDEFPTTVSEVIHFNSGLDEWKKKLGNMIVVALEKNQK